MECPKCYGDMQPVLKGVTTVSRCENCHGLYFDQLSQDILPEMLGNESVDTGSDDLGSTYDEMVFVDCPKCDKMMDQRLQEEPRRIRFELCPTCNATFLDAGELRLYMSEEYLENFRTLLPFH